MVFSSTFYPKAGSVSPEPPWDGLMFNLALEGT